MSQQLIIRDVRVEGPKPKGNEVLEIDADTPLKWPIAWILDRAKAYHSTYVWLGIIAHGSGSPYLPLATGWSSRRESMDAVSQGGAGLQFGRDGINLDTVVHFKALYDWLDWTDILSCGAAFITPGHEGRYGDGNLLCSRLAKATGAPVRASTATQIYDQQTMELGAWEGTVLTYGPKGNVINVETNPKI
jgi:hypothetical protein